MASKGDELVQYITEQVVTYLDAPREHAVPRAQRKRKERENWRSRWFGMLPLALSMWAGKLSKQEREQDQDQDVDQEAEPSDSLRIYG